MKKHTIKIVWGEHPCNSDWKVCEYAFKTDEELDAFMLGVNEMDGWHGFVTIGKHGDFPNFKSLKREYGEE